MISLASETCTASLTRSLNLTAFERTLSEFPAITIHPDLLGQWRPCKRVTGFFPSLPSFGKATALVTDGTVAWFLSDTSGLLLAHTAGYVYVDFIQEGDEAVYRGQKTGCPPQPYSDTKGKSGKPLRSRNDPRPRLTAAEKARDLAMSLLKGV